LVHELLYGTCGVCVAASRQRPPRGLGAARTPQAWSGRPGIASTMIPNRGRDREPGYHLRHRTGTRATGLTRASCTGTAPADLPGRRRDADPRRRCCHRGGPLVTCFEQATSSTAPGSRSWSSSRAAWPAEAAADPGRHRPDDLRSPRRAALPADTPVRASIPYFQWDERRRQADGACGAQRFLGAHARTGPPGRERVMVVVGTARSCARHRCGRRSGIARDNDPSRQKVCRGFQRGEHELRRPHPRRAGRGYLFLLLQALGTLSRMYHSHSAHWHSGLAGSQTPLLLETLLMCPYSNDCPVTFVTSLPRILSPHELFAYQDDFPSPNAFLFGLWNFPLLCTNDSHI